MLLNAETIAWPMLSAGFTYSVQSAFLACFLNGLRLKSILTNSYAVLPFINGVTQPLTRILPRHEIQVINKPFKTLQQEFPSPKFRPSIEYQPNVVYKIPCADCGWCYVAHVIGAKHDKIHVIGAKRGKIHDENRARRTKKNQKNQCNVKYDWC